MRPSRGMASHGSYAASWPLAIRSPPVSSLVAASMPRRQPSATEVRTSNVTLAFDATDWTGRQFRR